MAFKQLLYSSAMVAALAFSSCSAEGTKNTAADDAETDAILMNASPVSPGASSAQSATVLSSPAGQSKPTQGSTQAAKTLAATNPPHGEPGHRCDIEVGAPLNSPAAATTTPPAAQAQPAAAKPAASSGRVNPPHGQPGHDCAVAVGAALP